MPLSDRLFGQTKKNKLSSRLFTPEPTTKPFDFKETITESIKPVTKVEPRTTITQPINRNIPQRATELPQNTFKPPTRIEGRAIPSIRSGEDLLASTPIKAGFQKGFADAFGATGRIGKIGENITAQEEKDPTSFKRASYAGRIGGELSSYIAAGKIAKSIPGVKNLGQAGKLSSRLAVDQIIDNIAQAPRGILKDIQEDKSIDEITRNLIKQNVVDLAFNITLQAAGDLIQTFRKTADATGQTVEEVAESVIQNPSTRKTIQQELGLPDNFTAADILAESRKVADDIGAENYYKSLENIKPDEKAIISKPKDVIEESRNIAKTELKKFKPEVIEEFVPMTRGQGKRTGKMTMGGMGINSGIAKTTKYKETLANLGVDEKEIEHMLNNTGVLNKAETYLKAREYGLNHNDAYKYSVANDMFTSNRIDNDMYKKILSEQTDFFKTKQVEPQNYFPEKIIEANQPPTKLSERLKAQETPLEPSVTREIPRLDTIQPQKIASDIEQPTLNLELPRVDRIEPSLKGDSTPIDTKARVLTETPKRVKTSLSDNLERIYQEVISKNIPFENIGGKPNVQASNLNRVAGTIEYNTVGKQVDLEGNEIGKSIVDIFSDVPKEEKKELFDYVLNTHNIDRFREGKPVFGDTVSEVTSANIKQNYDVNKPQFEAKQKEITNYFSNLMNEWAVKSGLTSKETAEMLAEKYPNYIPTYRAKDLPKSMISSNQNIAQIVKKAKGGEDFILPIDQQMIAMTERTVKNARKNQLMNSLNDLYESSPESVSRYIKEVKGGEKEVIDDLLDVGRNFDVEPVVKGNEYVINFYKNGEPRQMVVNKTLYKALEDVQSDQAINIIANKVKKYATNPFKSLITGYNPIFAASNIMRDVPTALTYSTNPLKMSKEVPMAVQEMLTNGENFKLFKAMGGTREGLIGAGKEFKVPNLNETGKAFANAQKLNPIKAIGDVNGFTETLPRFSEFLAVLKETGDPALAVYKSAELTTDFSRHGNLTKLVDNFVPYLNPSVQGIDKFARSIKEAPLKTAVKGAGVITVPTIILDQINKDNEAYNNLSPRERNLYFQIPIPNSDKFFRVPKSRELGVMFSSLAEWGARASRGQKVTGEEIASTIKENFTPVNIESSKIWTPAIKAFKQIQDPGAYETNYWGGLIVPESQRRFSPGEQYDLNSSGIAKAIGQQFEVSPYVIDYFLKSYGGIVSQVVQPIGRDRKKSPFLPLSSKFITDPVYKSSSTNEFYDKLEEKKKAAQDYNKANNIPSKVVTPLEREANKMTKVAKQLSDFRKKQKALQTTKGNEEQLREIQKQINALATKTLKEVE